VLPPTLRPVVALIGRDAAPLIDTVRAFDDWAAERRHRTTKLPRGVGMHP
jgi:hypothetical protein